MIYDYLPILRECCGIVICTAEEHGAANTASPSMRQMPARPSNANIADQHVAHSKVADYYSCGHVIVIIFS